MNLAVFQTVGPLELLIVLGIVLMIFGPKRLPSLGRQLGAGMREFKDSVTRKSKDDDEDVIEQGDDTGAATRREAAAALGRPRGGDDAARRRRGRLREALDEGRSPRGHHPEADPPRGSPEPRRAPRRAAQTDHRLRDRLRRVLRALPWQDDVVLDIVNRPLENTAFKDTKSSKDPFERTAAFQAQLRKSALASAASYDDLAQASDEPAIRRGYQQLATSARALARSVPPQEAKRPVTLGVGEPFTATVRIAGYAALLIALPFLLYQAYAFVLPAFSREERSVALPLMAMVPFLFIAGVVFAYYMVLPNAINFLQNFNDDNFDILLQAKDYYRFSITVLIAMGLCFQVPVGILACTRLGIITVAQLRQSRATASSGSRSSRCCCPARIRSRCSR